VAEYDICACSECGLPFSITAMIAGPIEPDGKVCVDVKVTMLCACLEDSHDC
jgi:hypothetical protein